MKAKILICAVVAGSVLGGLVFGQSLRLSGTVNCVTSNQIELQCDGIAWVVKLTPASTAVTPSPAPGTTVTVVCKSPEDRKSTRLNSSHTVISYAVFCLKKKK